MRALGTEVTISPGASPADPDAMPGQKPIFQLFPCFFNFTISYILLIAKCSLESHSLMQDGRIHYSADKTRGSGVPFGGWWSALGGMVVFALDGASVPRALPQGCVAEDGLEL